MKEKFIKSTLILLIGGLITKILGMIIKIMMTRIIGINGLSIYMLILPTFSLFIGISQFGIPNTLSKLIAEKTRNTKKLYASIIPLIIIVNTLVMIIILISSKFIAYNLLHNKNTYYAIMAIAFVIPFTTISSICRSYFFGKEKMLPHVLSNIIEEIIRLLIIILFTPYFLKKGVQSAVTFIVLSNIISELISIIVLLLFIPNKQKIYKKDLKPSKIYLHDTISLSIPITTSRLISSIGYFLEPILITGMLLYMGYSSKYITYNYGIFTGYVIPMLLLPSFFTLAISQALLPIISYEYTNKNIKNVKKRIKQAIYLSLIIGIPVTLLFILNPTLPLKLIYNTSLGNSYLRFMAIFGLLQYIQSPLSFSLEAMGKSKENLKITIITVIIRSTLIIVLSILHIGIYSLIIATSINILITTLITIKKLKKYI